MALNIKSLFCWCPPFIRNRQKLKHVNQSAPRFASIRYEAKYVFFFRTITALQTWNFTTILITLKNSRHNLLMISKGRHLESLQRNNILRTVLKVCHWRINSLKTIAVLLNTTGIPSKEWKVRVFMKMRKAFFTNLTTVNCVQMTMTIFLKRKLIRTSLSPKIRNLRALWKKLKRGSAYLLSCSWD